MASRISQMRNGLNPQQQLPQQNQLNQSINAVRGMMAQLKGVQNPQAMLAQMLQNNSNTAFISNALRQGNNLEGIARQMATQKGIDIDELINQLKYDA